jgi:hypothetical protein
MNCCCRFGAAVSDEYPEFPCACCERHRPVESGFGSPDEMCRRHKRESTNNQEK